MIKNVKILSDKLKISFSNNIEEQFFEYLAKDHTKDEDSWDKEK